MTWIAAGAGGVALVLAAVALYYRSEALRYEERATFAALRCSQIQTSLDAEVAAHADDVRRLEVTTGDLRVLLQERDDEIERYLADDPDRAGDLLRRVLADVPGPSDGGPGVQTAAGSGGSSGRGGGGRS